MKKLANRFHLCHLVGRKIANIEHDKLFRQLVLKWAIMYECSRL
jgi:hypothetical protein